MWLWDRACSALVTKGRKGLAGCLDAVKTLMQTAMHECYAACKLADAILFNPITVFPCFPIAQALRLPCMAAYLQPIEHTRMFPGILFPSLPAWVGFARPAYNLLTGYVLDWARWRDLKQPIQAEAHTLPWGSLQSDVQSWASPA